MDSYHSKIYGEARLKEGARRDSYSRVAGQGTVAFSEAEQQFLLAAQYKIMRIRLHSYDSAKILDDIIDAYNFCAMFYNNFHTRMVAIGAIEEEDETLEKTRVSGGEEISEETRGPRV